MLNVYSLMDKAQLTLRSFTILLWIVFTAKFAFDYYYGFVDWIGVFPFTLFISLPLGYLVYNERSTLFQRSDKKFDPFITIIYSILLFLMFVIMLSMWAPKWDNQKILEWQAKKKHFTEFDMFNEKEHELETLTKKYLANDGYIGPFESAVLKWKYSNYADREIARIKAREEEAKKFEKAHAAQLMREKKEAEAKRIEESRQQSAEEYKQLRDSILGYKYEEKKPDSDWLDQ